MSTCETCGTQMQPTGSCHTCPGCGDTTGCGMKGVNR